MQQNKIQGPSIRHGWIQVLKKMSSPFLGVCVLLSQLKSQEVSPFVDAMMKSSSRSIGSQLCR